MLQKLIRSGVDVSGKVRAFPRYLEVGDYFTGTGSFLMIMKALKNALDTIVPEATDQLQARFFWWHLTNFLYTILLYLFYILKNSMIKFYII